jgi:hypothetical protein
LTRPHTSTRAGHAVSGTPISATRAGHAVSGHRSRPSQLRRRAGHPRVGRSAIEVCPPGPVTSRPRTRDANRSKRLAMRAPAWQTGCWTDGTPTLCPSRNWSRVKSISNPVGSRFQLWRPSGSPSVSNTSDRRSTPPRRSRRAMEVTPQWPAAGSSGSQLTAGSQVCSSQHARIAVSSPRTTTRPQSPASVPPK